MAILPPRAGEHHSVHLCIECAPPAGRLCEMRTVLITGAQGFIGRAIAARLAGARLVLMGRRAEEPSGGMCWVVGDLTDPAVRAAALDYTPELILHLASLPGGAAEEDFAGGLQINLDASRALALEAAALSQPPRFVFASSIAVFGSGAMEEDALPAPATSYGAHKLITEIFLADLARRGMLDARCVRLPGIVARPGVEAGFGSGFLSDMFHTLSVGAAFACPTGPTAASWLMSAGCCVDNLLHAAAIAAPARRVFTLPPVCARMGALAEAIIAATGSGGRVEWRPNPRIETLFASHAPLHAPAAAAAGFTSDGSVTRLVARVLAEMQKPRAPQPTT